MKRGILFTILTVLSHSLYAQSVGIGTNTPDPKAALEISSTTKGILIPSMSSQQRIAITSVPNGLLVYDTDKNEFYQYNGTGWRALLNGDYWSRPITNRSRISNLTDSVGIGLNLPTERLDVNGAIRTNSDLIIDNAAAIVQLKNNAVGKGFVQLSGDNLRLGTNSGNTTGNVVIRLNGNDRVQINPSGDLDLDGKVTRTAVTGPHSLLPVCYGFVRIDGGIFSGTGNFAVTKIAVGEYRITSNYIGLFSVFIGTGAIGSIVIGSIQETNNSIIVTTKHLNGSAQDSAFYFVIYQPS